MTELLPCPFCGALPEIIEDRHRMWGLLEHKVGCLWYFGNFPKHEIPERDFEAWNRRAFEFARDDVEGAFVEGYSLGCGRQYDENEDTLEEAMEEFGWVRERTCRNVCDWRDENGVLHSDARLFKCSECGYKADDFYGDDEENFPRYCPNCGAKVVKE